MKYVVSGVSCGAAIAFLTFGLIPEIFLRLEYFTALFVILIGMLSSFAAERFFSEKYGKLNFIYIAALPVYTALSFLNRLFPNLGIAAMLFSVILLYIACGGAFPQLKDEKSNRFALSGAIAGFIAGIATEFLLK